MWTTARTVFSPSTPVPRCASWCYVPGIQRCTGAHDQKHTGLSDSAGLRGGCGLCGAAIWFSGTDVVSHAGGQKI